MDAKIANCAAGKNDRAVHALYEWDGCLFPQLNQNSVRTVEKLFFVSYIPSNRTCRISGGRKPRPEIECVPFTTQSKTACENQIYPQDLEKRGGQNCVRGVLLTMFLKQIREIISTVGIAIVSLGTVWLAAYFGFVVHAVPDVDFGKLILLVGLVGAVGIWLAGFLILIMFASPAALLSYGVYLRRPRPKNVAMIIPTTTYRPLVVGVVNYSWLAFSTIAALLYANFAPEGWRLTSTYSFILYGVALLAIPPVIGCFDQAWRFRLSIDTLAVNFMSALLWFVALDVLYQLFPSILPDLKQWWGGWLALLIVILVPSIIGIISLAVSLRVSVPLIVGLALLVSPLLGQTVLGSAPRFVNIGSENRKVVALTNHAAVAIEKCNIASDPKAISTKYAPYTVSRHFTVFVLSDLGDEYIIKCNNVTAIRLTKREVSQSTVVLPGFKLNLP